MNPCMFPVDASSLLGYVGLTVLFLLLMELPVATLVDCRPPQGHTQINQLAKRDCREAQPQTQLASDVRYQVLRLNKADFRYLDEKLKISGSLRISFNIK
ncbi:hypothetical protein DPMN_076039 [Dreissena polymorpha]|uniref:Uncharacterized protein n=1 Tax=Dreissena polymorpha TaxID=45954 RepID=A0A9D4BN97_DREPO|nr:hypothetical protein DPMN_076039 [Dreissena polymorpha]